METDGRPQTMINKDTLERLTSIGLKNVDITKIFSVRRILVALHIKFHGLTNVLREPEDDNEITQELCEVHQFHPNIGHRWAIGYLREKDVKVKQARLRLMLKILKIHNPLQWK